MRVVSTLDIHLFGRETPELDVAKDNLRRFAAAGGRVAYGTDLGNGPIPRASTPPRRRTCGRRDWTAKRSWRPWPIARWRPGSRAIWWCSAATLWTTSMSSPTWCS